MSRPDFSIKPLVPGWGCAAQRTGRSLRPQGSLPRSLRDGLRPPWTPETSAALETAERAGQGLPRRARATHEQDPENARSLQQRHLRFEGIVTGVLQDWLDAGNDRDPLFPAQGHQSHHMISRDGFQARLTRYWHHALTDQPSLADVTLTPHVFRHTKAMSMRAAGHDISIIALWLGHEDISSTMKYLHADMKLKQATLERSIPGDGPTGIYQPTDTVLAFLDNLAAGH
ncbi:tyrosine-type recombinase/integrase [Nonomuraea sp. M3C6]|uniref:Tyrosine-type recombinase/integrase n=1 Tax=Nonomuraea marmarensis TaxID=3351344 RepID=A0ABW7AU86_9ACTN